MPKKFSTATAATATTTTITAGNAFKIFIVNRIPFPLLERSLQWWRKRPDGVDSISVMLLTFLTTTAIRRGLRRYRTAQSIPPNSLKTKNALKGRALAVNDSDNIRIFHYPPLLSNWRLQSFLKKKEERGGGFRNDTINCRLAGIDAPEMGHFGMGKQPFSDEAQQFLKGLVLNKEVSFTPHKLDQYQRAVCSVLVRPSVVDCLLKTFLLPFIPAKVWSLNPRMTLWKADGNVSLAMAHAGYATVYKDMGAEYGGIEKDLVEAERKALQSKRGMWAKGLKDWVSPSDHKNKA